MLRHKDEILTFEEICNYLKISKDTLYKHTQKKKIPSFKIGKRLRFKKESIDKWIAKQEKIKKKI